MNSTMINLLEINQELKSELLITEEIYIKTLNQNAELKNSLMEKRTEFEELNQKIKSLKKLIQIQEDSINSENDSVDTSLKLQLKTLDAIETNESITKWISTREKRRHSIDQRVRRNYSIDIYKGA